MKLDPLEYLIPDNLRISYLLNKLCGNLHLSNSDKDPNVLICIDTFEWLAFAKKHVFELTTNGSNIIVGCRQVNRSQYEFTFPIEKLPVYAHDCQMARIREKLEKLVGVRALTQKIQLKVLRHHLVKLNEDDKTELRVIVHEYQYFDPMAHSYSSLQNRLELIPIRGYIDSFLSFQSYAEAGLDLKLAGHDIMAVAFRYLGVDPFFYKAKSIVELDSSMSAETAVLLMLKQMLDVMKANIDGICSELDSEFLHDFRVSMRKSRSLLRTIKRVIAQPETDYILKNLSWLSEQTSVARDVDVYLLKFESYKSSLPVHLRDHLGGLRELLRKKKRRANRKLSTILKSKRCADFFERYAAILSDESKSPKPEYSLVPIKDLADRKIWKSYKLVLKEGDEIQTSSSEEQIHELRKSCKKLRYLMEFFRTLYTESEINQLIVALKDIQDTLGNFNDYHVQESALRSFELELESANNLSYNEKAAIDQLRVDFSEMKLNARRTFTERFLVFKAQPLQRNFKKLFKVVSKREEMQSDLI